MSETPALITITRKDPMDVQQRQVFVTLDGEPFATLLYGDEVTRDVPSGPHRLRASNTLVWKNRPLDVGPGEHARFKVISRPGFGSFTVLGLLGAGLLYLTDGHGGKTTASGTARGVNNAPRLTVGFPLPLRPNALNFGVGFVTDEDQCGTRDIKTEISGACTRLVTLCSFGGLDYELQTTQGPGECRVKVTFRDQWGAEGVATGTFPVAP